MDDPYRKHNANGMIDSLSAELEKVKAELVVSKNKVKELETTIDEERAAINDGWEYKLIYQNRQAQLTGTTETTTLRDALRQTTPEYLKKYGRTDAYVLVYLAEVKLQLENLGKQGWEFIKQDDQYPEVLWFRRKIKTT